MNNLLILLAGVHLLLASPTAPERHPQDGPDVDLRVRIETEEVEVQAIVNLAFCDEVIGSTRLHEDVLAPQEVPVLSEALTEKFHDTIRLKVDGLAVDANKTQVEMLPYEESDAEFFPEMGMKAVIKFKVTMRYSLKSSPRSVGLHWGLYPPNLALADFVDETIKVNAEWTAGADTKIIPFEEAEPEYIWHAGIDGLAPRFLELPEVEAPESGGRGLAWVIPILVFLAVMAGWFAVRRELPSMLLRILLGTACLSVAIILFWKSSGEPATLPRLTDEEAVATFNVLHANVYRAFDYSKESEIYDALSRSVEGELLADIYEQVYSSLILQDQGGAVCKVKKVTPVKVDLVEQQGDRDEFRVRSRWQVLGQVYHWGHTHMRTNEHLAEMSVRWSPTGWHIASSDVLEQFRVSATTNEGSKR